MTLKSDFQYIVQNKTLTATLSFCYYTNDQTLKRVTYEGLLMEGFGRNFSNEYSDLFEGNSFISDLKKGLENLSVVASLSGFNVDTVSLKNIYQTIQVWRKFNYDTFSIKLLFFDSLGSGYTKEVACRLELSQLPKINYSKNDSVQLTMSTPAGYKPNVRHGINSPTPNKTYSLYANGTATLALGEWAFFDNLIITKVDNRFSSEMLNTGFPMYVESTIHFKYWKIPEAEDIYNSWRVTPEGKKTNTEGS